MNATTESDAPRDARYINEVHAQQRLPEVGDTLTARRMGTLFNPVDDELTVEGVERTPLRECDLPRLDGIEIRETAGVIDERYEVTCRTPEGERVRFTGWVSNLEGEPIQK